MSRVLLFVQTGAWRPKCVPATVVGAVVWPRRSRRGEVREWFNLAARWWIRRSAWARIRHADRWWLVECENAEAGRQIIAARIDHRGRPLDNTAYALYALKDGTVHTGRILASGGRNHESS